MNKSLRSSMLVSKAWNEIPDQDMAIMMVDSVKRLSMDVKGAVIRLSQTKIDPSNKKMLESMKDGTYT